MLTLLVSLIVLALVLWGARLILAGLGAPAWLPNVVIGIFCIVAVILIAQALGIPTPSLK